jgi:uncharacterized protein YndB with AHSA1/START domain
VSGGDVARGERSAEHGTFRLERFYAVSPSTVFAAFRDPVTKVRWSLDGIEVLEHSLDLRVDGVEVARFRIPDGPEVRSVTTYHDVVTDRRLVFTFRMEIGGRTASVAVTTVEIDAVEGGSRLTYTEHATHLDGLHAHALAEHGTEVLLERLGDVVAPSSPR